MNERTIGTAKQLDGWPGINNLFQDGSVFFSGQPDAASIERLAKEHSIKTIVNLRAQEEMKKVDFDEPALAGHLGMKYINIPCSPPSMCSADVDALAQAIDSTQDPILIHCGSSERVGGLWAAYLVCKKGLNLDDALAKGKAAGLTMDPIIEAVKRIANQ